MRFCIHFMFPQYYYSWLMCENGMNPGVPLRSESETRPWYLKGLYFKTSDEDTHNFYLAVPPPPRHHPRNDDSDLFD